MTAIERPRGRVSSGKLDIPPPHHKYPAQRVAMIRSGNTHVFRTDIATGEEFQVWRSKKTRGKNMWRCWKEPMDFKQREDFLAQMNKSLDTSREDLERLLRLAHACHESLTVQESQAQRNSVDSPGTTVL